jgi:hypothetical protein
MQNIEILVKIDIKYINIIYNNIKRWYINHLFYYNNLNTNILINI